ncbi:hypothetical protein LSPH24S_06988 [Lysinibacillus sphaericus]
MDMLLFQLEKNGGKPLYDQLYSGIKEAIITKKITVEKLPSIRPCIGCFYNTNDRFVQLQ